MTQEAVLITGYPIKIKNFTDYDAVETALDQHFIEHYTNDGYTPTIDQPLLISVRRDYDSNELDDYGMYIAFDIQTLPRGDKVEIKAIKDEIAIPPELLSMVQSCGLEVEMKFGIYSDLCDSDRRWYVYTDKTKFSATQPLASCSSINVIQKGDNLFMDPVSLFALKQVQENGAVIGKYMGDNIISLSEEEKHVARNMGMIVVSE